MLAAQLYKAAADEGWVAREKVENILGISKDEADSFVDKDQSSAPDGWSVPSACFTVFLILILQMQPFTSQLNESVSKYFILPFFFSRAGTVVDRSESTGVYSTGNETWNWSVGGRIRGQDGRHTDTNKIYKAL